MASKYLKSAIYDQLKYVGHVKVKDLEDIKAEFCGDIEKLNKMIDGGIEIIQADETEERDIYYSVRKNGREIADANMRNDAIDAALKKV